MNQESDVFPGQNLKDPFDGLPVDIVRVAGGLHWQVRGRMWTSILFHTRQEAIHFVSTRNGKPPSFAVGPEIRVRELVKPEKHDSVDDDARRELNAGAEDAIDRTLPGMFGVTALRDSGRR